MKTVSSTSSSSSSPNQVTLSKSVSQKIREKQGEISDDETVQFQSHLLSLGVADPVTRESHGGGDSYTLELAKQVRNTCRNNKFVRTKMRLICQILSDLQVCLSILFVNIRD